MWPGRVPTAKPGAGVTKRDDDVVTPVRAESDDRGLTGRNRRGPLAVASRDVPAEPPGPGNGFRDATDPPSIFDADIPVIDLRDVLAGSGRRRFRSIPPSRRRWWLALGSLVAVMAAIGVVWLLAGSSPSDAIAPPVTSSVAPTTSGALTALPTVPVTVTPTTAVPPTTTTTTSTTTSTIAAVPPFIEPIGKGFSVNELPLHSLGMGPLRFGSDADQVLGVLAASLGQPNRDTGSIGSRGEYGTCPGDEIREVQWGPLVIVSLTGSEAGTTFYGYRVDGRLPDATGPALELQTLAGLKIGDTVPTLTDIYADRYTVSLTTDPSGGPEFEILSGRTVLLWGPLTSLDETGTVQGIFSAATCAA